MKENKNLNIQQIKTEFSKYLRDLGEVSHEWPSNVIQDLNTFKERLVEVQEFPLAALARDFAEIFRQQRVDIKRLNELLKSELICN